MGRPLFSARQPAVRVEPEPQHPPLQRWSYWNAFDPDADEFFENDDAVYEAFIDPASRVLLPTDASIPVVDVDVSSSSEASSSGRGTPMEVEDTDEDDARPRVRRVTTGGIRVSRFAAIDAALQASRRDGTPARYRIPEEEEAPRTPEPEPERAPRTPAAPEARPSVRERVVTYLDYPEEPSRSPSPSPEQLRVLRTIPSRPVRPSTPPAQMTPLFAPSPPPSVTPRLYSWSTLTAPAPASPLSNRDARMSVAHIMTPTHTLIPAHRVA